VAKETHAKGAKDAKEIAVFRTGGKMPAATLDVASGILA